MKTHYSIGFLLFTLLILFSNCEKEPQVVTETITVTDTIFVNQTDTLFITEEDTVFLNHIDTVFVTYTDTITIEELVYGNTTTLFMLRHADADDGGENPSLNEAGIERAEQLVHVFSNIPLDGIYTTYYNRTQQTATPIASSQKLETEIYDIAEPYIFLNNVLDTHEGGNAMIIGHSNTIPNMMNLLTASDAFEEIPEDEYNNLYVIRVYEYGVAEVHHLKYGAP